MSEKKSYVTTVFKHPLVTLFSTFFALFIAAIIPVMRGKVGIWNLTFGLIGMFCLMSFMVIITNYMMRLKQVDDLDEKIADLKNVMINNNLTWIVNQRYVQMVEKASEETWAFAPELTYAIQPDSQIFKGIQENLAKGHKYKIFMPDRPRVHKIVSDYNRLHNPAPGQVEFILLPHRDFLFHTIIVIYGVYSEDPKCIEWLPIREMNIWVQMDREHCNRMIGIGELLVKAHMPHINVEGAYRPELETMGVNEADQKN